MIIRQARKNTIPVVLLAGFLGTGKTTILNHILRSSAGVRIGVIVNDFGEVNIDSLLIAAETERKLELTNGCICCSTDGGELSESLDIVMASNPDVIIVEASGLAEPDDLAKLVSLSPNSRVAYGGLIYVVDAVNYNETRQAHPRVEKHTKIADLVVVTKTKQVTGRVADDLLVSLTEMTDAPVITVENGEVMPGLLFDITTRSSMQLSLFQQDNHEDHLHDEYQSVTFETTDPISPERFTAFMNEPPHGIYRMKGIVYFGMAGYEQKYIVQAVGKKWDMYLEEWCDDEMQRTVFVFIGVGLDEAALLRNFQNTIDESTTMIDIMRYDRK